MEMKDFESRIQKCNAELMDKIMAIVKEHEMLCAEVSFGDSSSRQDGSTILTADADCCIAGKAETVEPY